MSTRARGGKVPDASAAEDAGGGAFWHSCPLQPLDLQGDFVNFSFLSWLMFSKESESGCDSVR